MKSVKWIFLCGTLAGLMTACEKHPASEVPGAHGAHGAQGHGADSAAHADSHAAPAAHGAPAAAATPVPQYFPKQN